jgi:ADP-ribosylglycohydrolase
MLRPRRPKTTAKDADLSRDVADQPELRLTHKAAVVGPKPTRSSPVPWNIVVPTHRRESAIEGLVLGCSVAEALSISRNGIHPRTGLKLFGRNPLHFQFQPGIGVTSHRTHSLLMTVQAMLQSKTNPKLFASMLSRKIAWYQRAFPFRHAFIHLKRIFERIRSVQRDESMTVGLADDPLVRSLVLSTMLQGVADSASTWFQLSSSISHPDTRALHASTLVGYAAQLAQMVDHHNIEPREIARRLIAVTEEPELKAMLVDVDTSLSQNKSLAAFAKSQGWSNGIPSDIFASAITGIYAWLRHPNRFRNCVERTILLGGQCSGAAVVAGSLSGISLGRKGIPANWLRKISFYPHDDRWREQMIERVKDWPHGVEDIHKTLALPSSVFGQLARNLSFSAFRLIHGLIRIPMRLTQFSVKKRTRKSKR